MIREENIFANYKKIQLSNDDTYLYPLICPLDIRLLLLNQSCQPQKFDTISEEKRDECTSLSPFFNITTFAICTCTLSLFIFCLINNSLASSCWCSVSTFVQASVNSSVFLFPKVTTLYTGKSLLDDGLMLSLMIIPCHLY